MHVFHNRYLQNSSCLAREIPAFKAVLFIGVICWTCLFARYLARFMFAENVAPVESRVFNRSDFRLVEEADDELMNDERGVFSHEAMDATHGLVLDATFISPSGRFAMINGEYLEEGSTAIICKLPIHVESIKCGYVGLMVDKTSFRLPFIFKETATGNKFKTVINIKKIPEQAERNP